MKRNLMAAAALLLAAALITLGIRAGDPAGVQAKGERVCIECVGLGN